MGKNKLLRWEGIFVALWTPTDASGQLLETELQANLQFLVRQGVQGIMALGSTGEFLQLELPQRKRVLELAVANPGNLPVIANISDIRPRVVAELGQFARQAGAAAVSVLPPYFGRVARADLVDFFARAADAAQLPLILYNFPELTGNRIDLETIAAVADRTHLAGIKQSGAEFDYHARLLELGREKKFVVLTGADTRLPEALTLGATGCISGLANAVPDWLVEIFHMVRGTATGNLEAAAERMKAVGRRVETLEFPLNIAAAMEARGLPVGPAKTVVSAATRARYQKLVDDLRRLFCAEKLL